MTNQAIAQTFRRLADLLELADANEFKVRAYRNAADMFEDFPTPLAEFFAAGGVVALQQLPGVGAAISQKIASLLTVGTFDAYEKAKLEVPESVLDLLKVEGVGIKTAQILYRQFCLTNLPDFAKFVAGGGLDSVPRLGEKTQARIKASLAQLES